MKKIIASMTVFAAMAVGVAGCATDTSSEDSQQAETGGQSSAVTVSLGAGSAAVTKEGDAKQGYGNVPYTISPGLFHVGGGYYYSNGFAFCGFSSWEDYVAITGQGAINPGPGFDGVPVGMQNDGACQFIVGAGFFRSGFGYYSNGSHFCSCDHTGGPGWARQTHRRPDMPYDGTCGGC